MHLWISVLYVCMYLLYAHDSVHLPFCHSLTTPSAIYLNIKATIWSMQNHSAKISLSLDTYSRKRVTKRTAQMDGALFCSNYSICLIWQEYKQKHKWECCCLTEQYVLLSLIIAIRPLWYTHTRTHIMYCQMEKLKRSWKLEENFSSRYTRDYVGKKMTELSRGEGQVERRSRTEKLRKICLMKVNEPGLEGEGYTWTDREQSYFPRR